jgi:DNA anti-recombination protein RmuC
MYDKLSGFLKSMDEIEKQLDKARDSYKDARIKLSIISRSVCVSLINASYKHQLF